MITPEMVDADAEVLPDYPLEFHTELQPKFECVCGRSFRHEHTALERGRHRTVHTPDAVLQLSPL